MAEACRPPHTMSYRNLFIRSMCALTARPSLHPFWSGVSLGARYFDGIGSGSSTERSGELAVVRRAAAGTIAPVAVDAGANVGEYTAALVRHLPLARILAFDASASAADQLRARFRAEPRVEVVQLGLSDRAETLQLHSPAAASGVATFYEHEGEPAGETSEVTCVRLDDYCAARGLRQIGLLKVDVEGHELRVLQGAEGLLATRAIGMIQFDGGAAVHSRVFFRDYWMLLTRYGYQIWRVLPFGLLPVRSYRERDESCLPTIYLAEASPRR